VTADAGQKQALFRFYFAVQANAGQIQRFYLLKF
jgi:hypothetical protein